MDTRWGRFQPYFVIAGLLVMLLNIAVFSIPGGLSSGATVFHAYASYMLFQLTYSFVNIPYGSLGSAMTQLPEERAKLSSARSAPPLPSSCCPSWWLRKSVAPMTSKAP